MFKELYRFGKPYNMWAQLAAPGVRITRIYIAFRIKRSTALESDRITGIKTRPCKIVRLDDASVAETVCYAA
ncbi:hypothetical protein [Carnimonas nigrificans]|uniref:hypothetical protein n=1 Tax=Carnimonas nigrificans TaxID=64323 RepID=UPI0004B863DD|nr:hypothetical protein [Carnimonas nigrificans]